MKCTECNIDYPSDYLHDFDSSQGFKPNVCGICALELSNIIHGIKRTKFDGPIAEKMRQKAIKWRKEHKNDSAVAETITSS